MWLPRQMTLPLHEQNFQAMGVTLDAGKLSRPAQRAAQRDRALTSPGCTGSFVSNQGLIVTNHHCVQPALQLNSPRPITTYVEDGFLAKTNADELPAGPTQRVMVAHAIHDITKEMTDGLDKIKDPLARKKESEKRSKELLAACEKDKPGIRCQIYGHFRGAEYQHDRVPRDHATSASSTRPSAPSATTAARSTTGPGRATPATGRSSARTSARTASPPIRRPTTCRTSPAHWLKVSTAGRAGPTTSCWSPATRARTDRHLDRVGGPPRRRRVPTRT